MHLVSQTLRVLGIVLAAITLSMLAIGVAWADETNTPHTRATLDSDTCAACHSAHHNAPALNGGVGVVPDGDSTTVCLGCHSVSGSTATNVVSGTRDAFDLASGHSLITTPTGSTGWNGCSTCHNSHGAAANNAMIPTTIINGIPVTESGPEACLACHDSKDSWYGSGYPSTSKPTRDATGFPVSGVWPGPDTYLSSANAHGALPETTQTLPAGNDVKRQTGDCLYCHAAHRGANAYDGLLTTFTVPAASTLASDQADGSFAALCFTCHGGDKPQGFASVPVNIKTFVTSTSTATASFTGHGGHSIVTSGGALPVGSPLPCFECHNPHGSSRNNHAEISDELGRDLDTRSALGVRQFCFTCHSTSDSVAGWDGETSSYIAVSAKDTVVGLPRDGAQLRLNSNYGHNEVDNVSCYSCHGDDYSAGGNNVHDPSPDGQLAVANAPAPAGDTAPPVTVANLAAAYMGTVSLNATDSGSGVAETLYSLDGGVLTTGTVVVATGDGTHTAQFWSVDNASNVETPTIVEFLVDLLAPVTSSDASAAYVDTATITLTSQDNTGGVGVAETSYILDGGNVATGTVVTASDFGAHTLQFWSVDLAGNTEATQSVDFTVSASQVQSSLPPLALDSGPIGLEAPSVYARQVPGWFDSASRRLASG